MLRMAMVRESDRELKARHCSSSVSRARTVLLSSPASLARKTSRTGVVTRDTSLAFSWFRIRLQPESQLSLTLEIEMLPTTTNIIDSKIDSFLTQSGFFLCQSSVKVE